MAETMNERQEKELFCQSIDARLSGLQGDPWLTQRILARAEGKRPEKDVKPAGVRRKMSLGLVLALVLTLLSVSAVAAVAVYLSFHQIVEEEALPRAVEDEGDSFTAEDTNFIIQLAEENGIILRDGVREHLNKLIEQGEGYWKEELFMELFKAEYGQSPGTWSLETQKWFDEICVAIGFIEQSEKTLPGEGEITLEEAIAAAEDHIRKTYGEEWDVSDATAYELGKQYLTGYNGEFPGPYWTIFYEPLKVTSREFWVYLDSQGNVLRDGMYKGVEPGCSLSNLYDAFVKVYGWNGDEWDVDVLRKVVEASQMCDPVYNRQRVTALQLTTYPEQTGHPVSQEEAIRIAMEKLQVSNYQLFRATCINATPNPVWKITFRDDSVEGTTRFGNVEIDSVTGEMIHAEFRDGPWPWSETIVTQQMLDEVWEHMLENANG